MGGPTSKGGARLSAEPAARSQAALVSVVVVTYEPDAGLLRECLQSVVASDYRPLELVVVDNGSHRPGVREEVEGLLAEHPEVPLTFSDQMRNTGYAAATNVGFELGHGELVLLLNPDARLEPDAIRVLADAAASRPEAAGFAPKILLANPGVVIDSVGIAIHPGSEGSQRGLGQADCGQYDVEEQVAGLCFAAALIRRQAWTRVGPLDVRYFMFYEDVDWSLRAQVTGESFWTVPSARVFHFHSASTRHLGSGFKTRLIQRNLIWTAVKNLETRAAVRVLLRRSAANVRRVVRLRSPSASTRALIDAWVGLPGMVRSRREIQNRRRRRDGEFLGGRGEATFFDADRYQPEASVAALLAVLSRLYAVAPEPALERTLLRITSAEATGLGRDKARIAAMARSGGMALTPALEWLLQQLESG
ncbi:MAG: glycosyltransferase family 2 protein [Candidatus Dormibacteria bacterium]